MKTMPDATDEFYNAYYDWREDTGTEDTPEALAAFTAMQGTTP